MYFKTYNTLRAAAKKLREPKIHAKDKVLIPWVLKESKQTDRKA